MTENITRKIRCAIQYHEPFGRFNKHGVFVRTVTDTMAVNKIAEIATAVLTHLPTQEGVDAG